MRILAILLVAAVALAVTAGSAQIPRGTCLECHEEEGMRYADITLTPFQQIGQDSEETLEVTVLDPWDHEITSITAEVTVNGAIGFVTRPTFTETIEEPAGPGTGGGPHVIPFEIHPGATGVVVAASTDPGPAGANDPDLQLVDPSGNIIALPPDGAQAEPPSFPVGPREVLAYDQETTTTLATGNYEAIAQMGSATPDAGPLKLEVTVWYNATTTQTARFDAAPESPDSLKKGDSRTLPFLVTSTGQGQGSIDVRITLTAYYLHPPSTGQDEGNWTTSRSLSVQGSDTTVMGELAPPPAVPSVNWKVVARSWGEATGFTGLFMMLPALVLGGAFGQRNVKLMNKVVGNARTRILWHNSYSTVLMVIATVHLVLMLYEPAFHWAEGLLLGGIGLASLYGLAITGFLFRWFSRTYGYASWRKWHVALATLFVVAILIHSIADGSHFGPVRQLLG